MNLFYFFKLSLRSLFRNKVFTLLNILGLAIGLSTCLLLFLYINNELSYDSSVPDADRVFRITTTLNEKSTWAKGLLCLHEVGQKDIPEVEETSCFNFIDKIRVQVNDNLYNESNILLADTNFLDFFGIEQLLGDQEALSKPNSLLLSETTAQKYFGTTNPIGENFQIDGVDYTIAGIIENPKPNMHFTYNVVVSLKSEREQQTYRILKARKVTAFYIYYKLFDKEKYHDVEEQFPDLMKEYIGDAHGPPIEAFVSKLQPLLSIHLDSHLQFELKENSYRKYIKIFSFIAIVILLIACINFINMYTALSSVRRKEIGLKKIAGASRYQLVKQFLTEAFVMNLIAFFMALIVVEMIRPIFNHLIHDEIIIQYTKPDVILFSVLLLLISTVLSGTYTAFYMAGISPAFKLIYNKTRGKRVKLRDVFVIIQFASAIALIASTLMINKQVRFLQNQDVGFKKENVLILQMRNSIDKRDVLKESISNVKDVIKTGYCHHHFARELQPNSFEYNEKGFSILSTFADYDFIETMGLEFIYKGFKDKSELDNNIIINEAMLNDIKAEYPESTYDDLLESSEQIKGIVKDFNFYSLHEDVGGFAIIFSMGIRLRYLHVRYKAEDFSSFIHEIENVWTELYPDYPFEYFFLDEAMDKKYNSDITFGKVVSSFSLIAIIISCIGLLGLSLFHTQQRTKEIGIRKTLGATTSSIILLLNRSYLRWIFIAILLASPFVYYFMSRWLEGFAYRINFDWMLLIFAGVSAVLIAVITISLQSIKSSRAKPAESLRYE